MPPVELGSGIAVLRIPRLGDWNDRPPVVVEGVSTADLKKGPGHIPGTALPGEVGNVVLSGHRTTYGAPFERFDELQPGDAVVVETRDTWFTYTVRGTRIVRPSAVEVTYPVPGDPAVRRRRKRLLTMTTCHPRFSARQRMVVSAELTATDAKSGGPPAALALPVDGGDVGVRVDLADAARRHARQGGGVPGPVRARGAAAVLRGLPGRRTAPALRGRHVGAGTAPVPS